MNLVLKEWKGCDSFMTGMFFGDKYILDHFNMVLLLSFVTFDGNTFIELTSLVYIRAYKLTPYLSVTFDGKTFFICRI
jgi:hypothetical protein